MSRALTAKQKDQRYYLHSLIGLCIMFLFGLLPPFGPLTPFGMKMLGILIALIYLWSFVEMGWPCLVGMVAYLLTGHMDLSTLLQSGFGNHTVMISVFATAFAFAIADQGTFDYIARWLLSSKIFSGRPWLLSFFIMLVSYVMDILYAGLAIIFMLWALLPKICDSCGMKHDHPWVGAMVVGVVFEMVMGECTLPFKPMAMFMLSAAGKMLPLGDLPYVSYIVFMLITILVMTLLYLVILKFVLRIDLSAMKTVEIGQLISNEAPMNSVQKFSGVLLIFFIAAMILAGSSSLLPDSGLKTALSALSTTGVSFLFFAFAVIFRVEGKPLLNTKKVASQIPWEIVMLIAVINTVCPAVASPDTGISTLLAQITAPILSGHSTLVFLFLLFALTILLTNFFNNTVIIMIMLNILVSYYTVMNLHLEMVISLLILFSQIAFLLPASSMYGALCHSQAEMCGGVNIYKSAIVLMVVALLTLIIAIPLGTLLY